MPRATGCVRRPPAGASSWRENPLLPWELEVLRSPAICIADFALLTPGLRKGRQEGIG